MRRTGERVDLIALDLRLPQGAGRADGARPPEAQQAQATIVVFSGTDRQRHEVRELTTLGVAGYVNEYTAVQHILPSLSPHLYPDLYNRRSSPRVTLGIPVAYRVANTIASAVTLNISQGGLAIRTTSPARGRRRAACALPSCPPAASISSPKRASRGRYRASAWASSSSASNTNRRPPSTRSCSRTSSRIEKRKGK
jgi:hypothetical protein